MCGSAAEYKVFQTVAPQRPADELKEELAAIQQQYLSLPPSDFVWQKAIIGKKELFQIPQGSSQLLLCHCCLSKQNYSEAAHYQQELFESVILQTK